MILQEQHWAIAENVPTLPLTPRQVHEELLACSDHGARLLAMECLESRTILGSSFNDAPALYDGLVEFAADPSTSSLLVRAIALDKAFTSKGCDKLERAIPQIFAPEIGGAYYSRGYTPMEDDRALRAYNGLIWDLAEEEGINQSEIFPTHDMDPLSELPNQVPVRVCRIVDALIADTDPRYLSGSMPSEPFKQILEQLLNNAYMFRSDQVEGLDLRKLAPHLPRDAQLARLFDFKDKRYDHFAEFTKITKGPNAETYTDLFVRLAASVPSMAKLFPAEFQRGVELGSESLFANALYAIAELETLGDEAAVMLPLNDQENVLHLPLQPGEAQKILTHLVKACEGLAELADVEDTPATLLVSRANGYRLYRFVDNAYRNISVYVRPKADIIYDPAMEYGRPGTGVEASISFVVDPILPPGQLLSVGKHRKPEQPDNRISIRLDREGIEPNSRDSLGGHRDPMQEQGTLSLDIGSVLGDEAWLSTKVGRLLAWGNLLRAKAQGGRPHLNHVTQYFSPSNGQGETFAGAAEETIERLERARLNRRQLVARLTGNKAIAVASQPDEIAA